MECGSSLPPRDCASLLARPTRGGKPPQSEGGSKLPQSFIIDLVPP